MDSIERYRQLKGKVAKLQEGVSKAEGALEHLMDQIEKGYGCKTLTAAKKYADELQKKANDSEKEFNVAMDNFEEAWGEKLE